MRRLATQGGVIAYDNIVSLQRLEVISRYIVTGRKARRQPALFPRPSATPVEVIGTIRPDRAAWVFLEAVADLEGADGAAPAHGDLLRSSRASWDYVGTQQYMETTPVV